MELSKSLVGMFAFPRQIMGLEIQGGEHSSVEDARATLYIYQRVRKKWERELAGLDGAGKGNKHQRKG
eukprot:1195871-Prorocentrum_minimum.AAC.11